MPQRTRSRHLPPLLRIAVRRVGGPLVLSLFVAGCWPFVTSSGGGQTNAPAQQGPSPGGSSEGQPEPAPAAPPAAAQPQSPPVYQASVSVHNACREQVRLFRGRTNGTYPGSGTYGWHSSNSTSTYHLSGDDELCIVENDRAILACIKPPSGARVEITESCSGFRNR